MFAWPISNMAFIIPNSFTMRKIFTIIGTTVIMFLLGGCAGKKEKHPESLEEKGIPEEQSIGSSDNDAPDLLVPIKVIEHEITSGMGDEMTFKAVQETDEQIIVEPISDYYNEYTSSERMLLDPYPNDGPWCDLLNYPQIEFYITNNLDVTLDIQSLDIMVDESKADPLPYLYVYQDGELANGIIIWNEAWEDWGAISFDYKILKKGESFDGYYDRNLKIPYFEDYMIVDFYNDLKQMGYKPGIVAGLSSRDEYKDWIVDWEKIGYKICGHGSDYAHLWMPYLFNWEEMAQEYSLSDLFEPFEFATKEESGLIEACGFARFYGKLSFEKSDFIKEIEGLIYLTPPSNGGAGMDLDEQFDVFLKDQGVNYIVSKPYSTTIMPGKSERVRLTFKSARSAIHGFQLDFKNNNGLSIKSKKVLLHLLNGRHSSMQPVVLRRFQSED